MIIGILSCLTTITNMQDYLSFYNIYISNKNPVKFLKLRNIFFFFFLSFVSRQSSLHLHCDRKKQAMCQHCQQYVKLWLNLVHLYHEKIIIIP